MKSLSLASPEYQRRGCDRDRRVDVLNDGV